MIGFIIFGTRGINSTRDSGTFYCPSCRADRQYRHRVARRFFTLYFIPLIPLDKLGEYVECGTCMTTFKPEVLHLDNRAEREAFQANFNPAVLRALVQMMLADGVIDDDEIDAIIGVYASISGQPISRREVQAEIQDAQSGFGGNDKAIGQFAGTLNLRGKIMMIDAAYAIAAADGHVDPTEEQLLERMAQDLLMTERQFRDAMVQIRQRHQRQLTA